MLEDRIVIPIDAELHLRNLELEDCEKIFAVVDQSRSHLEKFATAERSIQEVEQMVRRATDRHRKDRFGFTAGLWRGEMLLGAFSYNRIRWNNKRGEIGFWLGERFVGKGYATTALNAFIRYGFTRLDLNRIEATTLTRNEKAVRLLERCRFRNEGSFRETVLIHGSWADEYVFSLLRRDWQPGMA